MPPARYYIEMLESDAKLYCGHYCCCTPDINEAGVRLKNGNVRLEFREYARYTSIPKSIRDLTVDGHGYEHRDALLAKSYNDQPWYDPDEWDEDPGPTPVPTVEE